MNERKTSATQSVNLAVTEREFSIIENAVGGAFGEAKDALWSRVMHGEAVDLADFRERLNRYDDAKCALMATRGWTNQRPRPEPVYLTGHELSEMIRDDVHIHSDEVDGFKEGDRKERAKQRELAARILDAFDLHERLDAWASCDDLIEFHVILDGGESR